MKYERETARIRKEQIMERKKELNSKKNMEEKVKGKKKKNECDCKYQNKQTNKQTQKYLRINHERKIKLRPKNYTFQDIEIMKRKAERKTKKSYTTNGLKLNAGN